MSGESPSLAALERAQTETNPEGSTLTTQTDKPQTSPQKDALSTSTTETEKDTVSTTEAVIGSEDTDMEVDDVSKSTPLPTAAISISSTTDTSSAASSLASAPSTVDGSAETTLSSSAAINGTGANGGGGASGSSTTAPGSSTKSSTASPSATTPSAGLVVPISSTALVPVGHKDEAATDGIPNTRTGYVYDVRMRHHSNVHGEDDHPEDPRRIWRIYDTLQANGCTNRMVKVPSREANEEELKLIHTQEHVKKVASTSDLSKEGLLELAEEYNSIYLNNSSAFCARLSCGSLLEMCKAVATGQILNGLAIIRPPGHHAEPDEAGGFCLFNNVAVATRYLQKEFGLKKIFILDWDVHHGNGTQKAFVDDPNVVYCSIHRYDDGSFYPGDPVAASHTMVGEGAGLGTTINIPWPCPGMGDAEYIYAFNRIIMPIAYEFAPDFVLVSAGFDAAKGDHIGEMLVTPGAYGHMTHMLKALAGGKIILALEGGYNLDSIAASGLACARSLLNDPLEPLASIRPNSVCVQTIHDVQEVHSRYWKSLTPLCIDPVEEAQKGKTVVELSKVLSIYRAEFLYQQHKMIKLPINSEEFEPQFVNNVHCTQGLYKPKTLFLFVHNLGDFCAQTMGASNIIRPEKSMLVDTVAQYVDNIIKSGHELIDVVVPYQPATEEDKTDLKDKMTNLLIHIWDNFIYMTGNTRRIVLLGTGFGCHSMVAFMNQRQKDMINYVSCAVVVPGGEEALPLVLKRLSPWYMENSFVVVADNHPIWERVNQKANPRLGQLVRSGRPIERISDSLLHLYDTMFVEIDRKLKSLPPIPKAEEDTPMEDLQPTGTATTATGSSADKDEKTPTNTNGTTEVITEGVASSRISSGSQGNGNGNGAPLGKQPEYGTHPQQQHQPQPQQPHQVHPMQQHPQHSQQPPHQYYSSSAPPPPSGQPQYQHAPPPQQQQQLPPQHSNPHQSPLVDRGSGSSYQSRAQPYPSPYGNDKQDVYSNTNTAKASPNPNHSPGPMQHRYSSAGPDGVPSSLKQIGRPSSAAATSGSSSSGPGSQYAGSSPLVSSASASGLGGVRGNPSMGGYSSSSSSSATPSSAAGQSPSMMSKSSSGYIYSNNGPEGGIPPQHQSHVRLSGSEPYMKKSGSGPPPPSSSSSSSSALSSAAGVYAPGGMHPLQQQGPLPPSSRQQQQQPLYQDARGGGPPPPSSKQQHQQQQHQQQMMQQQQHPDAYQDRERYAREQQYQWEQQQQQQQQQYRQPPPPSPHNSNQHAQY